MKWIKLQPREEVPIIGKFLGYIVSEYSGERFAEMCVKYSSCNTVYVSGRHTLEDYVWELTHYCILENPEE